MSKAYFVTAIGTPMTEDERLHEEGLEVELADQWSAGINGILVAGSMGAMQLLTDDTYCRLVERSVALSAGRGEILVGAGEAGFARTRDRILFLNKFKIDGVAVLAPYFWKFNQSELVVNAEMIEFVEAIPDTIVSLISGKKIMVAESVDMVIERVIEYKKSCNQPLFSEG